MSKATVAVPAEKAAHHPQITINDEAPPNEELTTVTRISPDHASYRPDKCLRRTPRNTQCIRFPSKMSLCYRRLDQLFFSATPETTLSSYKKPWEKVHSEPNIYVLENFLTTKEIGYLMEFVATKRFQRSFVDGENNTSSIDRMHRTSTFLSFAKQHDKTIATIEQRVADLLGTQTRALEALQLVRYEQGQFFGIHHDLGIYDEGRGYHRIAPQNDMESAALGGATFFPKAQLRVQPVAGSAVLFSNVLSNGMPDIRTLHAGEPPTSPQRVKYGLNIWFCEEF